MTTNIQQCKKPWNDLIVLADGKCVNCMFQNSTYAFGNITQDNIKHIWNSDIIKDNREKMSNGEIPDICKTGIGKCEFLKEVRDVSVC